MSFSIYVVGSQTAVNAAVAADTNVPEEAKELAMKMVSAVVAPADPGAAPPLVLLSATGHFDQYGGSCNFEVKRPLAVCEPAPEVVTAPTSPS